MANKLEDTQIRAWLKNNVRFDAKPDGNGLYLRFRAVDKAPVWFYRYKIAKKEHKVILGRYPSLTLAKARQEVTRCKAEILKGNNPAIDRKETKQAAIAKALADKTAQTVTELVNEYYARNVEGRCKTAKAMRQRIDNYLIPVIGKMRIDKVEPIHISNMLNSIVKAGAPTTANDVLSNAKQIFNYAIKRQIIRNNPAAAFDTSDAGGKEKARDRYLTKSELIKLFDAMNSCDKFTRHHYLCVKLLLLLGCRKSELFKARRADFNLFGGVWAMSLENKTGQAIDVPLSNQALIIIKELLEHQSNSEYLLPAMTRSSSRGHIDVGYLNKPIKEHVFPLMEGVLPFTIHDFRATLKTNLRKMGVDRFVTERCLNHKIEGMEGVYDRGDYFKERKAALQNWADFLESCEQEQAVDTKTNNLSTNRVVSIYYSYS